MRTVLFEERGRTTEEEFEVVEEGFSLEDRVWEGSPSTLEIDLFFLGPRDEFNPLSAEFDVEARGCVFKL